MTIIAFPSGAPAEDLIPEIALPHELRRAVNQAAASDARRVYESTRAALLQIARRELIERGPLAAELAVRRWGFHVRAHAHKPL